MLPVINNFKIYLDFFKEFKVLGRLQLFKNLSCPLVLGRTVTMKIFLPIWLAWTVSMEICLPIGWRTLSDEKSR
jgi:hypothetical protein